MFLPKLFRLVAQFISQEKDDLSTSEKYYMYEWKNGENIGHQKWRIPSFGIREFSMSNWIISTVIVMSGLFLFLVYEAAIMYVGHIPYFLLLL